MSETLDRARAAYERREWSAARELFLAASAEGPLSPADTNAASQCAWWLGDMDACMSELEAAHSRCLEAGDRAGAAAIAMELAVNHFLRGDDPVGSGWMGRAVRLAEQLPEGPIHGYLTYVLEVEAPPAGAEPNKVVEAASRVQALGRRFDDPTLVAIGLNGEGRALLRAGRVAGGLALLDEAMVSVLAGEVAPEWAGNLYCNTMDACHELGDLPRMVTWTQAAEDWVDTLPAAVLFAGICRVHRAQIHSHGGLGAGRARGGARVRGAGRHLGGQRRGGLVRAR